MKFRINRYIQTLSTIFIVILASTPAWSKEGDVGVIKLVSPDNWFVYIVIFTVFIGALITLAIINSKLSRPESKWSLADALSEEIEVTATQTDSAGVITPLLDETSKKPIMIKELRGSSSRMVALMGMIVILLMFLGFGAFSLFSFAKTGNMPDSIDRVVKFLVAGLTLFAPYVVNKFSSIFKGFLPK